MKCPICETQVLNNSDYSQHMNRKHRGEQYTSIKEIPEIKSGLQTGSQTKDSYTAKDKGMNGNKR